MSKKKTVQSNTPWAPAQPYILKGLEQSGAVFDQQQPTLNKYSGMQMDTYGRVAPGAEAGIIGAQGLVNDTISGKYLSGNPYLDAVLGRTRENVGDAVAGEFMQAGRYGSGYNQAILARELADAENSARMQDYSRERAYQNDAVGQAQQLMGGSQSLLNNAAELPWIGVGALNGNVRNASGGYGTTTTKQSGGLLNSLLQAGTSIGSAAIMASDAALKTNVEKVGEYPDGLGIYEWDYLPIEGQIAAFMPEGRQRGVMADEVAELRPYALGPVIEGYATVNYGAL